MPTDCLFVGNASVGRVMGTETTPPAPPPPKLLDQVRDKIRVKHYSICTETQYVHRKSGVRSCSATLSPILGRELSLLTPSPWLHTLTPVC